MPKDNVVYGAFPAKPVVGIGVNIDYLYADEHVVLARLTVRIGDEVKVVHEIYEAE
jgi:hypothetical protein